MSLSHPTIGIIGGMGPAAGADLLQKIIRNTVAGCDQEHLPVILLSFPHRLADRTAYLTGQSSESPAPAIANILRGLDRMGVAVAGMPCNTAHAPEILDLVHREMRRHNVQAEFVNMIEATLRRVGELPGQPTRVGVLSTIGARRLRLYPDALRAAGFEAVELEEDVHDALAHRAVYDPDFGIKVQSTSPTDEARALVLEGIERLVEAGAEAVILGCTELPLAVPDPRYGSVPLVDPASALARELILRTFPDRLTPLEA